MNWGLLLELIRSSRASLLLYLALMTAEAVVTLALPWFGGRFIDHVFGGASQNLGAVVGLLLCLFAVQAALRTGTGYLVSCAAERILAEIRRRVFRHLQLVPLAFHEQRRKGELLAQLSQEATNLAGFIAGPLMGLAPLLLTGLGAVVLMIKVNWLLGMLAAILVPATYLGLRALSHSMRSLASRVQIERADIAGLEEESLGMIPVVKAFGREQTEIERHERHLAGLLSTAERQARLTAVLSPTVQFVAAAAAVLALWAAWALGGNLAPTPGDAVTLLLYSALLTRPMGAAAAFYAGAQQASVLLRRVEEVLTEPLEPGTSGLPPLSDVRGDVEFQNVSFSYVDRKPALDSVSLKISAGETVAIIGENGAGKSTLAHLLLRLHTPGRGRILIDGIDAATVDVSSLRRQVGLVAQHTLLWHATVRDNIAFGRNCSTEEEISAAARMAQAEAFILGFPDGYDTVIGDQGLRLSGGQRQRIALARALLKDPPILVLDEATSMFAPEAERDFLRASRDAFSSRTVILITHRPASLEVADRVLRLTGGRLIEEAARSRWQWQPALTG